MAIVLSELSLSRWQPLANAAQIVAAATPHLQKGAHGASATADDGTPPSHFDPGGLVALADAMFGHDLDAHDAQTAFAQLDAALVRAATRAEFVPGKREPMLLQTPDAPRAIEVSPQRSHVWALDLCLSALLVRVNLMPFAVPLPHAITAEALNPELLPRERALVLAHALQRAADRVVDALFTLRTMRLGAGTALATLRTTARAPLVFDLLVGLGPLRPAAIMAGCGLSRLGALGVVHTLRRLALAIETPKGVWRSIGPSAAPIVSMAPISAEPPSAVVEFDQAMADIDALLDRHRQHAPQSSGPGPKRAASD
jgi:hypothetical protein